MGVHFPDRIAHQKKNRKTNDLRQLRRVSSLNGAPPPTPGSAYVRE
jgi:hypothetical protein